MVATATKTRKPERRVHLYNAGGNPMLLEMTVGKEEFAYFVKKIHADYGMGFEVKKLVIDGVSEQTNEVYHVHYDPARRLSTCDCLGGLHHGHCKHQEAIVALIQSGKIDVAAVKLEAKAAPKQPFCDRCNDNPEVYCDWCSI